MKGYPARQTVVVSVVFVVVVAAIGLMAAVGSVGATDHNGSIGDVEIEYTNGTTTSSGTEAVAAYPWIEIEGGPVEINESITFEIENTNTGDSVVVEPNETATGDEVQLYPYEKSGTIREDSSMAVVKNYDGEHEREEFGVTVTGDESTFENSYDSYVVTMYENGEAVGKTSESTIAINHKYDPQTQVTENTIEVSFNAEGLSADAELDGYIEPGPDVPNFDEIEYDSETDRYVATVDREKIPDGEYRPRITVTNPDDPFPTTSFGTELVVGDGSNDGPTLTLEPADSEITTGETATFEVVVSGAQEGVSAYEMQLRTAGNVTITDFDRPLSPDFDATELNDAGTQLSFEDGMGSNTYEGDDRVVIANVTVEAGDPGAGSLSIDEDAAIADLDTNQYDLVVDGDTSIEITEEKPGPEPIAGDTPPQDLNGDGTFEDIDGDGEVTVFDVQTLFSNLDDPAVEENPGAFNFAGDENPTEVTIFDVQSLFGQI